MKREVLFSFEHKGVQLIVYLEKDELLWVYRTDDEPEEWRPWDRAYLPTQVNKELTELWKKLGSSNTR